MIRSPGAGGLGGSVRIGSEPTANRIRVGRRESLEWSPTSDTSACTGRLSLDWPSLRVITAPMWNLGLPYALKYYIDCVVQPGYLFRYDETGQVVPMVNGKRMVCVTSRGADYSAGTYLHPYDFQEPYLRTVFGFVGITDVRFIHAQPMDITPHQREAALTGAVPQARELGRGLLSPAVGLAA
ncbi:NAD(P)H-dependent oxidoreductase [Catellatospora citrea]|uniref:FMN-dependent NADH-azoreductase n=1 Tax=Catellatospora citrea TaxID=53366 RepID=UPI00340AC0D2